MDIFEDSDSLVLIADMPGVSKERLDVRVDGNTLVLEGDVQFDLPEKAEAVYADVRSTAYRRSFVLSQELDTDQIQANLKDGVLSVRIPKRAAVRARRSKSRDPDVAPVPGSAWPPRALPVAAARLATSAMQTIAARWRWCSGRTAPGSRRARPRPPLPHAAGTWAHCGAISAWA